MKKIILNLIVVLTVFSVYAMAQEKPDYTNDPGYVDFGNMPGFMKSENVTEVNIEGYLLKMVSKATRENDPELSKLLSGLKLVKVYSFNVEGKDQNDIFSKINNVDNQLEGKNWNRIVKVRGPKENTNVYIKTTSDQNNIVGLVVTSLEKSGQVAFVNIVGNIDMDAIGRLGHKFNIPSLDSVKNKEDKK